MVVQLADKERVTDIAVDGTYIYAAITSSTGTRIMRYAKP
jgi:hypothetical protein